MNTLFKLNCSVWALLLFSSLKSQQTDWNQINSSTALGVIAGQASDQNISYSHVTQEGNFNNADLSLNAKTVISVKQLGDNNSFYFNNSFAEKEVKTAVTTQGNNNSIDITGSNSISDGLKMNIQGDNMTIFMRNY
ncbi:hypothetical protein M2347_002482 [Chryseobacterium sp. H1D6B]|uniref:hypothetical protein n=1 Tax=Chryseobacterium sp. H1D6B TaxID=2940588 RepID=UPI0015CC22AD|nr:hypothetical protein [Chryseobacterium sp. H1D6B]MDH6252755.1 hypothetical protein [Chryseobacterium sp. H1D6B]